MLRTLAAALSVALALSCEGMVRTIVHTPKPTMFHGDADGWPPP